MKIKLIILLLLIGILGILGNSYRKPAHQVRRIVIDAGHGGHDPGCRGKISMEKDVALEIALEVGELVKMFHEDVEIIYTRSKKTQFVELRERARIANKNSADLFISIHCNAHPRNSIFGTETYVMGLGNNSDALDVAMRENAVILNEEGFEENYEGFDPNSPVSHILLSNLQHAYYENSLHIASNIEHQFSTKTKRTSRGVKQAGFLVLAKTSMPAVLVEVGFLTNEKEEIYLNSDLGKSYVAASIYRAIRDYKKETETR